MLQDTTLSVPAAVVWPSVVAVVGAVIVFTWKALLRGLWVVGMRLAQADLQQQVTIMAPSADLAAMEAILERQGQILADALTKSFIEQTSNLTTSVRAVERNVSHIAGFLEAQRGYNPPP